MSFTNEEWDWPQPRRTPPPETIELEIVGSARRVDPRRWHREPARATSLWKHPATTRAVNAYGRFVLGVVKVIVSLVLLAALAVTAWLFVLVMRA